MQKHNHIISSCQQLVLIVLLLASVAIGTYAQQSLANRGISRNNSTQNQSSGSDSKKVDIEPNVKAWRMIDGMSLADTIPVDTLLNLHQINNPIWKNNIMNVTLGVLGSPYQSRFFPTIRKHDGNIFYNSLLDYIPQSDQMIFYNTLTPYTNLAYQMGYPKRRSEEYVHAIFTQNINRRANVGFQYSLSTSIGMYANQRTDQSRFRMWNSYDGDYYHYYLNLQYNHSEINENGGLVDRKSVLQLHDKNLPAGEKKYDSAEDMPVRLSDVDALNKMSTYELKLSHMFDLAHITRLDNDSNEIEIAPIVARHTLTVHKNHSHFMMSNLDSYKEDDSFAIRNIDEHKTRDNRKYYEYKNEFELKMTEDFNSMLKFGVRAFFGVDVRRYRRDDQPEKIIEDDKSNALKAGNVVNPTVGENNKVIIIHKSKAENEVSTYLGGQIFKNVGENLRWKAGVLAYLGKNRNGDVEANGEVNITFPILKYKTDFYGKAWFERRSPEYLEKEYYSNHFEWSNNFGQYESSKFESGIRIPDLRLNVYAFGGILNDWIYFNEECKPAQFDDKAIKVMGVYGEKHFSIIGFNSIVRMAWQHTSNDSIMPLPEFSLQASNFYEAFLFDVLTLQIGFDVRFNSKYYAPKYMPALMQYCAQRKESVGGYGFFDPYINFHLKRARVYLKYEHVNSYWGATDYFHTTNYAAAPATFKFGLSWNFYD